jgi:hypothetical protein
MGVGKTTFTFSNSSITLDGGSTNINLTRDNQSYTNKLSHGYGDIYTFPSGSTDYTWTPTASQLTEFFEEIPSSKTRPIDVYLDTYNGSTKVGRDTHTLTVTLSEATGKPTLSGFTVTDSNTVTSGMGIIVVGKSTLTASQTSSAKYGASITKTVYTYGSNEYFSINNLIGSLSLTNKPVSYSIGCKVVDSRGFSVSSTLGKVIARYEAPTITTFEVIRCDSSGNETDFGTKAKVIIKGSWSALKVGSIYKNPATLKIGYKTKTTTSYTYQTITVSGGIVDIENILSATLDANTDYQFNIQFVDKFETYSEDTTFSNSKNIMYVSADGSEINFDAETINFGTLESAGINMCDGKGRIVVGKPDIMFGETGSFNVMSDEIVVKGKSLGRIGASQTWEYPTADGMKAAWSAFNASAIVNDSTNDTSISLFSCKTNNMGLDGVYSDVYSSSFCITPASITANDHGVENLAWMYCNSSTSTAIETYTSAWTAINMTVKLSGTGDSSNYFTMSTGGKITFKKAGLFRIKLNIFAYTPGGRIGVGIFNGTTEEYSSATYSGGVFVTASCEVLLSVTANATRIFKCIGWPGSGSNWYLRLTKTYTNVLVEYLGPS